MRWPWQNDPEPRVRLSDVALLANAFKGVFEAGVEAAKPAPMPEQFIMTPEQILEEQARMESEAAWMVSGGSDEPEEAPEDD